MPLSFNLSLPTVRESTGTKCTTPEDVIRELADLRTAAQECFVILTLDTKNRIIDQHVITIRILNASLAHPREVFRPAIMDAAAPKSVDVTVHKLRHRIGYDLIRTVAGVGYSFPEAVERGRR